MQLLPSLNRLPSSDSPFSGLSGSFLLGECLAALADCFAGFDLVFSVFFGGSIFDVFLAFAFFVSAFFASPFFSELLVSELLVSFFFVPVFFVSVFFV
eukprot:CAMPEP_0172559530 /NCGR_PEP_ID=MMETSP1067-20121228/84432_1 /TAXON_ID=265564 ORGANISM="Thalassiosira punctigera, Strain Tpunct2005C2" /NCGR_SAMPLE_ID=MMETSP1067 /ASSEMBLY_ACC=CAM_ASM_000444 /LENGTH=97 /DNA_ID=CAMNT_0013349141 /DNA_START=50 /DNA_END=340 /DNA_ORIENTATION=-